MKKLIILDRDGVINQDSNEYIKSEEEWEAIPGSLDAIVMGLLLSESDQRRHQVGANKMQAACAMTLQHLALSDAGKGPLRSHTGVMTALRTLASVGGSLSDEARRSAAGALFELDETRRSEAVNRAKAVAVVAAGKVGICIAAQHDEQSAVRVRRAGDEPLAAIDDVLVPLPADRGLYIGGI